jgi:hypothetical protein
MASDKFRVATHATALASAIIGLLFRKGGPNFLHPTPVDGESQAKSPGFACNSFHLKANRVSS